ncbi:hypothetical protein SNEBB_010787 [Seison nebaliae]|nr:hypothetical protein SNEBB_010787 [Seison nebaliae]
MIFLIHLLFFQQISAIAHQYNQCSGRSSSDVINVHLIPHSHDDVGWLKTIDQYFYGTERQIHFGNVNRILTSVVENLLRDEKRKFVYAEMAFFSRWWALQTEKKKKQVKQLVENGQFQFVLGGWCMNDEATAHYAPIIMQHELGLKFIKDNFGESSRPVTTWQIDPFGHSLEMSSLFDQIGYDSLFFGRLDYQDHQMRKKLQELEFLWEKKRTNYTSQLFTSILPNNYSPPNGFCFDVYCNDDPLITDENSLQFNLDQKLEEFIQIVNNQSKIYKTSDLIMTMGNDMNYVDANYWFSNLDILIEHINKKTQIHGIHLFYSTPACYYKSLAISHQGEVQWSKKYDDFFPYAHRPHAFWTGFYTSRPTQKFMTREIYKLLQAVEVLSALNGKSHLTYLNKAKQFISVAQHHDAITGTEKQKVAYDYEERLSKAENLIIKSLEYSLGEPIGYCRLRNISECHITERNENVFLNIFNRLGRSVEHVIRIPVSDTKWQLICAKTGKQIEIEFHMIDEETLNLPTRNSSALYDLIGRIDLDKFQMVTLKLQRINSLHLYRSIHSKRNDYVLENENIYYNLLTGMYKNKLENIETKLLIKFYYYVGFPGNNSEGKFSASGAYLFRPLYNELHNVIPIYRRCVHGNLMSSCLIKFQDGNLTTATQLIRLYENSSSLEIEWMVQSINIDDGNGKEFIIKYFALNLTDSNSTFYTDMNGRSSLKRIRNYRPTWQLNQTEWVAGNYYPITSFIYINNQNIQLSILTDRAEGASSIGDGEIEIMIHRRLLYDDALGVGEPLNETDINGKGLNVIGKHYLQLHKKSTAMEMLRKLNQQNYFSPLEFFSKSFFSNKFPVTINDDWPDQLNLLTFAQMHGENFTVRLENVFDEDEDPVYSKPIIVNIIKLLFGNRMVMNCEEMGLGNNINKVQLNQERLRVNEETNKLLEMDCTKILFLPMQIRTFQIELMKN